MKHRKKGRKLNRSTKHRSALMKNLSLALFEHGAIKTTEAKAKAVTRVIAKLVTTAKKQTVPSRREIAKFFGKRQPTNHLVDTVTPQLKKRVSGFTRIVRLGKRQGDDTMMVRLELIDFSKPVVESKAQSKKKSSTTKKDTKKSTKAASLSKAPKRSSQKPGQKNLPVKKVRKNLSKV